jgi:hypothetical protein
VQSTPLPGTAATVMPQALTQQGQNPGTQQVGYSYGNYSNYGYYYPQTTSWTPPSYWYGSNGN